MFISHPTGLYVAAASLLALTGAVADMRTRRIPNALTLPAIVAGLLLHSSLDGWSGLGSAALGAVIAFVVFLVFFIAGGMGAGDVKLMTAVAAVAGAHAVTEMLIMTAIAGGVLALALAVVRGRLKQTFINLRTLFIHHRIQGLQPHPELNVGNAQTLRLPYGMAIAAGCLITLFTQWHQA